ncbi:hypothetical protein, conserved [Leishmania tarentolae]|uniref:Uncharacterized protein n=1 Tax=Leishmania tarentolae TaxID=5689 RepID=A0A640K9K2_LEITA|nr:hypothetical protein, conserved [Leishmania tarentolae]
MAFVGLSNAPRASHGGGATAMPPPSALGDSNRSSAMPLPPGAYVMKAPYPPGRGGGAAGLMGPTAAVIPPGFGGKIPPGQMLMMAGSQKLLVPPPSSLAAGDRHALGARPPLSGPISPGAMASPPAPPGCGPVGPPRPLPQFACLDGKKIMVPPGVKLLMGSPGPSGAPAAAAAAPPQAVRCSNMMMPSGQGWEASRRLSPTPSTPPGVMGRGAAAAVGGGGGRGSPSPVRMSPGQRPEQLPMQATALPSGLPPTMPPPALAAADASGGKSQGFDFVRSLTNAFNSLRHGSASSKKRSEEQQQQQLRNQTPTGLSARGQSVGSGPAGPHSSHTATPSRRSLVSHPADPSPAQGQQSTSSSQWMGNATRGARHPPLSPRGQSPMPMRPSLSGSGNRGAGIVVGAKKAIMGPPMPGGVYSRAGSAAAASPPGVPLAPSPLHQPQHLSPAGPRLVKRIVGPPTPHARLIPATPQQQRLHAGSTASPTASLPPAAAAAANALRVPHSTVLKEEQMPEAGVRSPGRRLQRLGESSEESNSNGGDGGVAHIAAQAAAAAASHSRGPSYLHDAPVVEDDKTQPPMPSSPSSPRGTAAPETKDQSHHSTDAKARKPTSAAVTGAAMSRSPSSGRCDNHSETSASRGLRPVRQTVTTATRSAAAAAKRRQEEEEHQRYEAAHKNKLESKLLRSSRSKSAPCTKVVRQPKPASTAGAARERRSLQEEEEEGTQKPSSMERSIHSIVSTTSDRALPSASGSSASAVGEQKSGPSPTRGGGSADGDGGNLSASPGSAPMQAGKRTGKSAHLDPSDTRTSGQWQRQFRGKRSALRSQSASRGRGGNNDAYDEEDAESSSQKLTSTDLYRLAKILRDGSTDLMGVDVDHGKRRGRRHHSHHRGDNGSDRGADVGSSDESSWGSRRRGWQRRQYSSAMRRSAAPLSTVGLPWRYAGTQRSLEPFASPPPVRRPLGYINIGGGRYARVGGSPYTRSQSRPRATSVGAVPLDRANTRPLLSDFRACGSYSPLSSERSRGASALRDAFRNAASADGQRRALLESQQASSERGGGADGGAAALYYRSQQRQRFGSRSTPPHPHIRGGRPASEVGLEDTLSSAADSQHPYCVSTSALVSAAPSMTPLRGRSSPLPSSRRWAADQSYHLPLQAPPSAAAVSGADTVSVSVTGGGKGEAKNVGAPASPSLIPATASPTLLARPWEQVRSRSLHSHPRTPSPSTQERWQQEQRYAQLHKNCTASGGSAATAAAVPVPAGRYASDANLDARCSPSRKEEPVCLRSTTSAPLSTRQHLRDSHGGVGGSRSVTAQTCSKWLDEIIDATTVTATGVRAGGGAGGGGEHAAAAAAAAAAANAIPVVDLRREFKPRIDEGTAGVLGGPSRVRAASPSLHNSGTADYREAFIGSRARPHVPGIAFKYMIGARSATGSPPRTGGEASATGGGAVSMKTVNGVSDGLPFSAYSSIRIHDPARKSPWALAPEREGLKVLPGKPALSRRRRIPVDGNAGAENGAADPRLDAHDAGDARHRARGATRTVVEEVHLDEHRRPYLIVRPVPSSEEGEAQRVSVKRLSRPKPIYRRANDLL